MCRYEVIIKLLYSVDDLVMLNSIFTELKAGFSRMLHSSFVESFESGSCVGLPCVVGCALSQYWCENELIPREPHVFQ